jgi:hypothetical protein
MTRSRQTADWGSRAGLAKIVPSSVAVGSGTGSADSLGTVTFSAVSSVSLNNVFSATYRNYRIVSNITAGASPVNLQFRLRASGSDQSGSSYFTFGIAGGFSSLAQVNLASQTSARIGQIDTDETYFTMDAITPNLNKTKQFNHSSYYPPSGTHNVVTSVYNSAYVADGLTLFPSSSTISGTVSVYGYN